MNDRVWAFSNGTEYRFWESENCDQCVKGYDRDADIGTSPCELNNAIFEAGCSDGRVPRHIADRLGWKEGEGSAHGRCLEFEAKS